MGGGKTIYVIVEFDESLFSRFSAETWNAFARDLPLPIFEGSKPPPLSAILDFSGIKRRNADLDGIDLSMVFADGGGDLSGSSLRHAHLFSGKNVLYRNCLLDYADFSFVEISGCDFTGATGLEMATFEGAIYDPLNPPKGLPVETLARCKPMAEPMPESPCEPAAPQEPTNFTVAPLRVTATIHTIPLEA